MSEVVSSRWQFPYGTRDNAAWHECQAVACCHCALALAAWNLGVAQSKAGPSPEILAIESKWNEAYKHGDVATEESLLAGNFVITVEEGTTFSKSIADEQIRAAHGNFGHGRSQRQDARRCSRRHWRLS